MYDMPSIGGSMLGKLLLINSAIGPLLGKKMEENEEWSS
jgi:hypothetical protein